MNLITEDTLEGLRNASNQVALFVWVIILLMMVSFVCYQVCNFDAIRWSIKKLAKDICKAFKDLTR